MVTKSLALVGSVALVLAAGQGAALADWKTNAAKKTVERAAREGMEKAAKNAAVDVALDAVVPGASAPDIGRTKSVQGSVTRPASSDSGRRKPAEGTTIGSAAGEGLDAAMMAANMAKTIDAATEVADAAKRVNKVRKVVP